MLLTKCCVLYPCTHTQTYTRIGLMICKLASLKFFLHPMIISRHIDAFKGPLVAHSLSDHHDIHITYVNGVKQTYLKFFISCIFEFDTIKRSHLLALIRQNQFNMPKNQIKKQLRTVN